MLPKSITLTAPWNDIPAGAEYRVLQPGEEVAPGAVDGRRAAQLLANGLAVPSDQVETASVTKRSSKGGKRG